MADLLIPDLNHRTRELVATVDEMDNYDLNSADHDSCVRWLQLRRIYTDQLRSLVMLIGGNVRPLLNEIESLLRDH